MTIEVVRSFKLRIKEAAEKLGFSTYEFAGRGELYSVIEKTMLGTEINEWVRKAEISQETVSVFGDENLEHGKKLAEFLGIKEVVILPPWEKNISRCPACNR